METDENVVCSLVCSSLHDESKQSTGNWKDFLALSNSGNIKHGSNACSRRLLALFAEDLLLGFFLLQLNYKRKNRVLMILNMPFYKISLLTDALYLLIGN